MVGRDSESVKITFRRRQRSRRLGHMLVIGVWLDHQEAMGIEKALTSQLFHDGFADAVVDDSILCLEFLLADELARSFDVQCGRPSHW